MNRPQGRWLRFVYKRIVPGDIRKLSADSADSGTGGGARDLRFNPADKFWPVFEQMFTKVPGKKFLDATLIWSDGATTTTEVAPPTPSRSNEARITRVNACCPENQLPSGTEESLFILIQTVEGTYAFFMTRQDILSSGFTSELESFLIRALEYSENTKVPTGFVDLAHDFQYSSVGGQMNTANFQPYFKREDILAAARTKPFVLLAGISGTGKSRLVRQLARGCCPSGHDFSKDAKGHVNVAQKPGNFEIIPVRPNWHDSTELMGYVTRITKDGNPKYVLTPFVKFLAKAWMNPGITFFLCLDEMNLAPVEQYFAEYLSAIEARKWVDAADHTKGMKTDVVVKFGAEKSNGAVDPFVEETAKMLLPDYGTAAASVECKNLGDAICEVGGISIPPNLVVMGTVNMDETTCSFSRKVLDRAMTFELNDVSNMYTIEEINGEGSVPFGSITANQAKCSFLGAKEAVNSDAGKVEVDPASHETRAKRILDYIKAINDKLENTPFKIAYRSRDEIMIYCLERVKDGIVELPTALDEATSMKILSRIEGDEDKLAVYKVVNGKKERDEKTLLDVLDETIAAALKAANGGNDPKPECKVCKEKLEFMKGRLSGGFTNFFV